MGISDKLISEFQEVVSNKKEEEIERMNELLASVGIPSEDTRYFTWGDTVVFRVTWSESEKKSDTTMEIFWSGNILYLEFLKYKNVVVEHRNYVEIKPEKQETLVDFYKRVRLSIGEEMYHLERKYRKEILKAESKGWFSKLWSKDKL